ncbi:NADP oxidoreductase coenzyme f420-dependent [Paraburkholderia ribeironis]|uniref:NADP oxidoreductase coenzyme f420-dependent n=1 Tax=Paraburkholderia ribeironis TaxID=1247936 RepID=A0A1N7S7B5_9BURK|nr:pyrroline-5-carboxylate reductase [Paraburkholderia ribeironis]SIT43258.1 NADP oxidoreductase coenzyme f420-dependent [Paraburkholderia ribeironis]
MFEMRIGFVGTGGITRAIVTGLLKAGAGIEAIAVSNRNAHIAKDLAALHPKVRVCGSNQQVLEASDVVCLAVRPQVARDVIRELDFAQTHRVISFIPGLRTDELARLIPHVAGIARAVPLPAVEQRIGTTSVYPPDDAACELFSTIGTVVEVESEDQFDCLHAATATMASYFAFMQSQADWLIAKGLPPEKARSFLSSYCAGMAHRAEHTDYSFPELIQHSITPGGINEKVLLELSSAGAFDLYPHALDGALAWINGVR